jgi:hypothetical protein
MDLSIQEKDDYLSLMNQVLGRHVCFREKLTRIQQRAFRVGEIILEDICETQLSIPPDSEEITKQGDCDSAVILGAYTTPSQPWLPPYNR